MAMLDKTFPTNDCSMCILSPKMVEVERHPLITGHPTIIGDLVSVGHGAIIHGCTISDEVLVGMGAIVMNGAVVGEGSIIGAGAVVTEGRVVPPGSVVLGVPGKIVREVAPEQREHIRENAMVYIEMAGRYRRG